MSLPVEDPKKQIKSSPANSKHIVDIIREEIAKASNPRGDVDPAVISLDLRSGNVTVEVAASEDSGSQKQECCAKSEATVSKEVSVMDSERLKKLQARLDDLLAGRVRATPSAEDSRLFAPFLPDDKIRGSALAGLCEKIAARIGGIGGLEAAVDELYEGLNHTPFGTTQYAAKLFLTHYKPARELLLIRSLEERQPQAVLPSSPTMRPR